MNFLLKLVSRNATTMPSRNFTALTLKPSLALVDTNYNKNINSPADSKPSNDSTSLLFTKNSAASSDLFSLTKRHMYTFRLSNKIVRNKHATRPKKTNNNSVELTYEQAQFAEKIGLSKSWNSWNTCN